MHSSLLQYFHVPLDLNTDLSLFVTWAGHRVCAPGFSIGPRSLDTFQLVFVLRGKGYLTQGKDEPYPLISGDAFFLFPMEQYHYAADVDDPCEILWIAFNGQACETILDSLGVSIDNSVFPEILNHDLIKKMNLIIYAVGDKEDKHRLSAIGYLHVLLSKIGLAINQQNTNNQYKPDSAENVAKIIDFIEQNYNKDIDIDTLCKHINYSRSYISKIFKEETQMSITQYMTIIRIKNAKRLLRTTSLSIKQVAATVGIKDPFYFSQIFKRITGQAPKEYRASFSES